MRTIKYRSWDGKKMREWGFVQGGFISPPSESGGHDYPHMQFTGLHDKNGEHEIYEGDKLEDEAGNIGVVEFDGGHFIIRHENGTSDFIAPKNKFKVIGNKYEN